MAHFEIDEFGNRIELDPKEEEDRKRRLEEVRQREEARRQDRRALDRHR
ncbi:hypothetical protein ABZ569_32400 [Streptomyces albus]